MSDSATTASHPDRRSNLEWLSRLAMASGLVAAYGTLAGFMGRFLYPPREAAKGWMFVTEVDGLAPGESLLFRTPGGSTVNIARQAAGGDAGAFIALSSTCPHLGCQVHWESQNERFFCPCHNGIFDPNGQATGGPPAEAGQSLPRYPLKVEGNLLYLETALDELAMGEGEILTPEGPVGPGHDPCLAALPSTRA